MNSTKTILGHDARKKALAGVDKVYNAVRLTLGPGGKNVLLPRTMNRGPRSTNDGVTVSENVRPKDVHERLAADFFKEASKRTNEQAGDGTTTTAVIGGHLINKILRSIPNENIPSAGVNKTTDVMTARKQIKEAKDIVIEEVKKRAKKIKTIEDLEKIAFVSVEDMEIGKIVAKMVWELGVDNYIDVTEGYKGEIETEVIKGMRFPAKVAARSFVTDVGKHQMVAEDVAVFVTNYKLDNPYDVVEILNKVKSTKIAIISPEFSPNVIVSLIQTTKNGVFCYPVATPSLRTAQLEDLAIYTGATLIDKETGRKVVNVSPSDLGGAERIVVKETENKEDAVLLGGKGDKIRHGENSVVAIRIEVLKKQMEEARNAIEKEQLKRRIANISSAVGVIRVGASTNAESLYIKLKVEDGVYACKAALESGYVKGGGLCLKEIAESLPESILTDTLKEPHRLIQENSGGVDIGDDIIDPAKVVQLEVEHGASVASEIITWGAIIADEPENNASDGYNAIAKVMGQLVYFHAKERGMMKESEEEAESDRSRAFSEALLADKD